MVSPLKRKDTDFEEFLLRAVAAVRKQSHHGICQRLDMRTFLKQRAPMVDKHETRKKRPNLSYS